MEPRQGNNEKQCDEIHIDVWGFKLDVVGKPALLLAGGFTYVLIRAINNNPDILERLCSTLESYVENAVVRKLEQGSLYIQLLTTGNDAREKLIEVYFSGKILQDYQTIMESVDQDHIELEIESFVLTEVGVILATEEEFDEIRKEAVNTLSSFSGLLPDQKRIACSNHPILQNEDIIMIDSITEEDNKDDILKIFKDLELKELNRKRQEEKTSTSFSSLPNFPGLLINLTKQNVDVAETSEQPQGKEYHTCTEHLHSSPTGESSTIEHTKRIDMDSHIENVTEKNLAETLRTQFCDPNGREKNPKKCAEIFHKLGKIYMNRTPDKICLIQSAALFNAALARNPENVEEIQTDISNLCSHILQAANVKTKDADLINKSKSFKENINKMRTKTTKQLKKFKHIPDIIDETTLLMLEQLKIALIQRIQDEITKDYKSIMKDISEYCTDVMGQPPCEFTLVGMGSLARSEITPYSDFENLIILEEEAKLKENYEQILEYFRWFAVIFQIILTNLQETIIPSVAIPSLNIRNSKTSGWYFDAYTTHGVSFDGMMPHACKSPLGRTGTDAKPWKTELIKPVSEMVHYLDEEEDLKNGYHLADLLTKTCFVAGSNLLYEEFYQQVQNKPQSQSEENIKLQLKNQVSEDLDNFGTRITFSGLLKDKGFNMKRVVYRSTTIFISALGRLNNISSSSSFDIITDLAKKGLISDEFEHKLKYAVAVACEVRLKVYMEKEGQDDWIDDDETLNIFSNSLRDFKETKSESPILINAVGERSMIEYFRIAYSLQYDVAKELDLNVTNLYSSLATLNLSIYYFLKLFHKVAELPPVLLESPVVVPRAAKHIMNDTNYLGFCFDRLKVEEKILQDLFSINERLNLKKNSNLNRKSRENLLFTSELCLKFGDLLRMAEKYDEACEHYKRSLTLLESLSDSKEKQCFAVLNALIGICLLNLDKLEEATLYFQETLNIENKLPTTEKQDFMVADTLNGLGTCFMEQSNYVEAKAYFEKAINMQEKISLDKERDLDLCYIYYNFGACLLNMKKHECSLKYCRKALKIMDRFSLNHKAIQKRKSMLLQDIALNLRNMGQYKESLESFQQSVKLCYEISGGKPDKTMASLYGDISRYLLVMHDYVEATSYALKSLNIYKQLSSDESNDEDLATSYLIYSRSLFLIYSYDDALHYADLALNIFENLKTSSNHDKQIARAFGIKGAILKDLNKLTESQNCFKKALELFHSISSDQTCDEDIALTSQDYGQCLIDLQQLEVALKYLHQSLSILRKISFNEDHDDEVADCMFTIGSALVETNKCDEALGYLQTGFDIVQRTGKYKKRCESSLIIHTYMGICFADAGNYMECLEHYHKCSNFASVSKSRLHQVYYDMIGYFFYFASRFHELGNYTESLYKAKQGLRICRLSEDFPRKRRWKAELTLSIGLSLRGLNQHRQALMAFKAARDIFAQLSYTDHAIYRIKAQEANRWMRLCQLKPHFFSSSLSDYFSSLH